MQDDNPPNSEKKRKVADFFADVQTKLQELQNRSSAKQYRLMQLKVKFQENAKRSKAEPVLEEVKREQFKKDFKI